VSLDFDRDREAFFEKHRRNDSVPSNSALKLLVLEELLAREFEAGETYSKAELTDRIGDHFDRPIELRRELVNFGYARHDNRENTYTVRSLELSEAEIRENAHLERHAQEIGVLE
jgi:hypothetical protein